MAAAKRALRTLARRIQSLEQEIEVLLSDLESLTQAVCPGLRQAYGVGVDSAATLLTAAGDNPEGFRSDAGFAALCGVSPLPASSGKTNRHRLNRGGNRQANAALLKVQTLCPDGAPGLTVTVKAAWDAVASSKPGAQARQATIQRSLANTSGQHALLCLFVRSL